MNKQTLEAVDKLVESYNDDVIRLNKDEIVELENYLRKNHNVTDLYRKITIYIDHRAFDIVEDELCGCTFERAY